MFGERDSRKRGMLCCSRSGLILGLSGGREEAGIRGAKAAGGSVVMKQVGKVGGGLVMEDFVW